MVQRKDGDADNNEWFNGDDDDADDDHDDNEDVMMMATVIPIDDEKLPSVPPPPVLWMNVQVSVATVATAVQTATVSKLTIQFNSIDGIRWMRTHVYRFPKRITSQNKQIVH